MKGLLIYSGGMDSTVLLHSKKDAIKLALFFDYGSNHNDREFVFAKINTEKLGIELRRIDIKSIMQHMKSSLLEGADAIPEGRYDEKNMSSTVVPFRNGIMLSIAAGIADTESLNTILLAAHKGDYKQYPDCREAFITAMSNSVYTGTNYRVCVDAPYGVFDKKQIAEIGAKIETLDFAETWSCYKADTSKHCGKCGTCIERIEALDGLNDPTEYEDTAFAFEHIRKKR